MNTLDIRTALVEQGYDDNSSIIDLVDGIYAILCGDGHGYGFGYNEDEQDELESLYRAERLAARLWGNVEVS